MFRMKKRDYKEQERQHPDLESRIISYDLPEKPMMLSAFSSCAVRNETHNQKDEKNNFRHTGSLSASPAVWCDNSNHIRFFTLVGNIRLCRIRHHPAHYRSLYGRSVFADKLIHLVWKQDYKYHADTLAMGTAYAYRIKCICSAGIYSGICLRNFYRL